MEPEYNAEEIETAAKKLKNNKAAGGDEVSAELIIYGVESYINRLLPCSMQPVKKVTTQKRLEEASWPLSQNSQRRMNK